MGKVIKNKKYLLLRPNEPPVIVTDPHSLYKSGKFNQDTDELYELGQKVMFNVTLVSAEYASRFGNQDTYEPDYPKINRTVSNERVKYDGI